MQRKSILIPLIALLAVGAVWASSMITPDKPGFPSLPSSPGTLGSILSLFGVDGTARDTVLLDGRPATDYVQNTNCTTPGEVWKGIDATGKVICGTKSKVLTQVGRITAIGGAVTVIPEEGAASRAAVVGDILKEGSRVQTAGGGSATITFTDDLSILRLDQNTRVDIRLPTTPTSTSIASVIVNDGVIWGRVLTSSGVEFGGGGLIAGVRGTSVSVEKDGIYYIAIPHSTQGGGAAHITCPGNATDDMGPGEIINTNSSCQSHIEDLDPSAIGTVGFYKNSEWVRKNTRADITYLESLATSSQVAKNELMATLPQADERTPLCINYDEQGSNGTWFPGLGCRPEGILAIADYIEGTGNMITPGSEYTLHKSSCEDALGCTRPAELSCNTGDTLVSEAHSCDWPNKAVSFTPTYTENGISKYDCVVPADPLNHYTGDRDFNSVPWTNYSTAQDGTYGGARLSITCAKPPIQAILGVGTYISGGGAGAYIVGTNQYISYNVDDVKVAVGGTLAGKTITIDLTTPTNNGVILDMGSACKVSWKVSTQSWSNGGGLCPIVVNTPMKVAVRLPSIVSWFYIGNQKSGLLPIGATIQKITLQ